MIQSCNRYRSIGYLLFTYVTVRHKQTIKRWMILNLRLLVIKAASNQKRFFSSTFFQQGIFYDVGTRPKSILNNKTKAVTDYSLEDAEKFITLEYRSIIYLTSHHKLQEQHFNLNFDLWKWLWGSLTQKLKPIYIRCITIIYLAYIYKVEYHDPVLHSSLYCYNKVHYATMSVMVT